MIPAKMAQPFCLAAGRTKSDPLLDAQEFQHGLNAALYPHADRGQGLVGFDDFAVPPAVAGGYFRLG